MGSILTLLSAPSGGVLSMQIEQNGGEDNMPFDITGAGGGGLTIGVIALLVGLYFVFMKKKNKMIGYGLIGFWAWQSGILANLMGTGAV